MAAFAARQWMDVFSPSNVPWMNPDVLNATQREQGLNLFRGSLNWLDDLHRIVHKLPPAGADAFSYEVDGAPIWFTDIRIPCFAVGTISDHVAPWKSAYKLHLLPLDITFVLTIGGHNAGIVSEPERERTSGTSGTKQKAAGLAPRRLFD